MANNEHDPRSIDGEPPPPDPEGSGPEAEDRNAIEPIRPREVPRRDFISRTLVSGFAALVVFGATSAPLQADGGCGGVPTSVDDDRDENCNVNGNADQGCGIRSAPATSGRDSDQNCNVGVPRDQDNSCGDCDDNHDPGGDETCGTNRGASTEKDELCGHAHFTGGDEDGNCGQQQGAGQDFARDEGCGVHNGTYNSGWTDPDGTCGGVLAPGGAPEPDRNCSALAADATCGQDPPAYSSDPDEKCSATDHDEACGQSGTMGFNGAYDEDESCGHMPGALGRDEACGTTVGWIWESDANCGEWINGQIDVDENCKIVIADPDASD